MHDLHSMQSGLSCRLCGASSSRRGLLLYRDTGVCSQAAAALLVLLAAVCERHLATGVPWQARCAHKLLGCFCLGVHFPVNWQQSRALHCRALYRTANPYKDDLLI